MQENEILNNNIKDFEDKLAEAERINDSTPKVLHEDNPYSIAIQEMSDEERLENFGDAHYEFKPFSNEELKYFNQQVKRYAKTKDGIDRYGNRASKYVKSNISAFTFQKIGKEMLEERIKEMYLSNKTIDKALIEKEMKDINAKMENEFLTGNPYFNYPKRYKNLGIHEEGVGDPQLADTILDIFSREKDLRNVIIERNGNDNDINRIAKTGYGDLRNISSEVMTNFPSIFENNRADIDNLPNGKAKNDAKELYSQRPIDKDTLIQSLNCLQAMNQKNKNHGFLHKLFHLYSWKTMNDNMTELKNKLVSRGITLDQINNFLNATTPEARLASKMTMVNDVINKKNDMESKIMSIVDKARNEQFIKEHGIDPEANEYRYNKKNNIVNQKSEVNQKLIEKVNKVNANYDEVTEKMKHVEKSDEEKEKIILETEVAVETTRLHARKETEKLHGEEKKQVLSKKDLKQTKLMAQKHLANMKKIESKIQSYEEAKQAELDNCTDPKDIKKINNKYNPKIKAANNGLAKEKTDYKTKLDDYSLKLNEKTNGIYEKEVTLYRNTLKKYFEKVDENEKIIDRNGNEIDTDDLINGLVRGMEKTGEHLGTNKIELDQIEEVEEVEDEIVEEKKELNNEVLANKLKDTLASQKKQINEVKSTVSHNEPSVEINVRKNK